MIFYMVRFQSKEQNQWIQFKAIGYQFPGENDSYFDDNWLHFEIEIRMEEQIYMKKDPFLLTRECLEFSKWFLSFPTLPVGSQIFNLENTFYFYKLDEHSNQTKENLRIELDRSLLPDLRFIDSCQMILDFHISNADCLKISDGFQQIVNQYPIRSSNKI